MVRFDFTVPPENGGQRLDQYLVGAIQGSSANPPILTRTRIQTLIEEGKVKINQRIHTKISYKIKPTQSISIEIPPPQPTNIISEQIPLDIIYEDQDLLVINKKAGMVVHPGSGNYQGTLVNALLYRTPDLSGIGGELRPGIVHRLDKETSGVMVVAKNDRTHTDLSQQFKSRQTSKKYIALVRGIIKEDEGRIEKPIGRDNRERKKISTRSKYSREAVTEFKVMERFKNITLVEVTPKTGRTHQIRVHFALINHPIIGDKLYGRRHKEDDQFILRQALHAQSLGFTHPGTGIYQEFFAPLPEDFLEAIERIRRY